MTSSLSDAVFNFINSSFFATCFATALLVAVSREEMDHFTVRSHGNAQKAHDEGWYDGEVLNYEGSNKENGIKPSTYEKVRRSKARKTSPSEERSDELRILSLMSF